MLIGSFQVFSWTMRCDWAKVGLRYSLFSWRKHPALDLLSLPLMHTDCTLKPHMHCLLCVHTPGEAGVKKEKGKKKKKERRKGMAAEITNLWLILS